MVELTPFRRRVLDEIQASGATDVYPHDVRGHAAKAASWLSTQGLVAEAQWGGFFPVGELPAEPGPARLPIPRVRATSGSLNSGPWAIDFGTGVTATITVNLEDRSAHPSKRHDWTLDAGATRASGHCFGWDRAYLQLWCRASSARPIPGLDLSDDELRELEQQAEQGDAGQAANVLRDLLRRRTGFAWSVRRGRGTSSEYVTITAVPARQARGAMTVHDTALLAGVLGEQVVNPRGVSVEPERRGAVVRAVAGDTLRQARRADENDEPGIPAQGSGLGRCTPPADPRRHHRPMKRRGRRPSVMSLTVGLERDLLAAAGGAVVTNTRVDVDSGFVSAQLGDRSASVDIFWDDDRLVANICAGDGDRIEPGADFVQIENPGTELARKVLKLLKD